MSKAAERELKETKNHVFISWPIFLIPWLIQNRSMLWIFSNIHYCQWPNSSHWYQLYKSFVKRTEELLQSIEKEKEWSAILSKVGFFLRVAGKSICHHRHNILACTALVTRQHDWLLSSISPFHFLYSCFRIIPLNWYRSLLPNAHDNCLLYSVILICVRRKETCLFFVAYESTTSVFQLPL